MGAADSGSPVPSRLSDVRSIVAQEQRAVQALRAQLDQRLAALGNLDAEIQLAISADLASSGMDWGVTAPGEFTRYWKRPGQLPPSAFAAFVPLVQRLLAALDVPLAGPDGTGSPILTPALVAFTGGVGAGYEPCTIPQRGWSTAQAYRQIDGALLCSCTTRGLPYDQAVAVTLLALKWHVPRMLIFSTGGAAAWATAGALFTQVTGWPAPRTDEGVDDAVIVSDDPAAPPSWWE